MIIKDTGAASAAPHDPVGEAGAPTPPTAADEGLAAPSPEDQPSAPAGVTGPLAPLFALLESVAQSLDAERLVGSASDIREAAAAIERHVQDMESAIEEWAFDQGYDSVSSESIVVDIRNRAAALPAREKGTE